MLWRASPRDLFTWCVLGIVRKFNHTVWSIGENNFPGTQSSSRNLKSIVKTVLLSIVLSPSISGNIILGSCYHGSMDHFIQSTGQGRFKLKVHFLITSPKIHSCHFRNIVKVSPKSISVSSIESNDEINKLTLFLIFNFLMNEPTVYWGTSRSDMDRLRTVKGLGNKKK